MKYRNADSAFIDLLSDLLTEGDNVESRNGKTLELSPVQFTIQDSGGVTLTERRASLPAQIAETMWVLSGRNDIEWLSRYLPRAKDFSDDGKTWRGGYGPRLRRWGNDGEPTTDQLAYVVDALRADPTTRQAVMVIWDPATDTLPGLDRPCNNWLHFLSRDGVLNLHVATRSNDIMWGWSGINVFEWSALLQLVAELTGLEAGAITFSISSLHLYEHHWDRARKIVGEARIGDRRPDPKLQLPEGADLEWVDRQIEHWFRIEQMIRDGKHELAEWAILDYPIRLWRDWLRVLLIWSSGDEPEDVSATLPEALWPRLVASPALRRDSGDQPTGDDFTAYVKDLHRRKNAAYGGSWQEDGEVYSIIPNVARKIHRLGKTDRDETAVDTAIDLMVYLVKYAAWMMGNRTGRTHVEVVEDSLDELARMNWGEDRVPNELLVERLRLGFETLKNAVSERQQDRKRLITDMLLDAYPYAARLWADHEKWKARNATRRFNGYTTVEG